MEYTVADIIPKRHELLVEVNKPEDEKTAGGLYLAKPADKNVSKTYFADVVKLGSAVCDLTVGMKVVIPAFMGINSAKYILIPDTDILGIADETT